MTHEWDALKRDCAQWIEPDALEDLMEGVKPGRVDNRTLVLELAHRFDRGSRLGRALRVLNDYRAPTGGFHPMSSTMIIGSVRFMFEAGDEGEGEDDLEDKLRRHLDPADLFMATYMNEQTMGFFAFARTPAEVRAQEQAFERHFESSDDPSVAEAREWLAGSEHALASNRFQAQEEARAFVEALYAAGAPRVVIENINDSSDGRGAYADSMVVHLPPEPSQRQEVLRIINEVGRPETEDGPLTDPGTGHVGLWWD